MVVTPCYLTHPISQQPILWAFTVGIYREGVKLCDMGVMFDQTVSGMVP